MRRGKFVARQSGFGTDARAAVDDGGAAERRVIEADKMSELMEQNGFDELRARSSVIKIGEPGEDAGVERRVGFNNAILLVKQNDGVTGAAGHVHAADGGARGPEHGV